MSPANSEENVNEDDNIVIIVKTVASAKSSPTDFHYN